MRFHITTPKTKAGRRTIPMLSDVKNALLTEYNLQMDFGFCDEEVDGYTGFIFQNRYGGLLSPHDINRAIDRICNAYNKEETKKAATENREPLLIRHFSVHNLRHTFCTRFCENETNLKVIQEIMGHADIETTMNLLVLGVCTKSRYQSNETRWKCKCQNCGRIIDLAGSTLRRGNPYGHCRCTRFKKT